MAHGDSPYRTVRVTTCPRTAQLCRMTQRLATNHPGVANCGRGVITTAMPDVHNEEQRCFNMSRVRGRYTTPELAIRRGLHARGLRFRLYHKDLSGRLDFVFLVHRAVEFVHSCFWHGHDCGMFVWPETRTAFWQEKIGKTRERDQSALKTLRDRG